MKKIVALGGSNSRASINKTLAGYVANQLENTETIIADLNDFTAPLYAIDYENEHGIPEGATKLYNLIGSADGLVISLAEHNGFYTAAFKSIFDWMSRIDKEVWQHKPMLLMATSPGGRGGKTVFETAKQAFPRFGGNIITDFSLPSFQNNFSEKGIVDIDLQNELAEKIKLFQESL